MKIAAPSKKRVFLMVDETALQNYLLKCELQYRADHADGVERVGWLMEYTRTAKQTARFLRDIGRCGQNLRRMERRKCNELG